MEYPTMVIYILGTVCIYRTASSTRQQWRPCMGRGTNLFYTSLPESVHNLSMAKHQCRNVSATVASFHQWNFTTLQKVATCLNLAHDAHYFITGVNATWNTMLHVKHDGSAEFVPRVESGFTLCEAAQRKNTLTDEPRGWARIGLNELLPVYTNYSFQKASKMCRHLYQATLVTFNNVSIYFQLQEKLQLSNNTFWVNDSLPSHKCLFLDVEHTSLAPSNCNRTIYAICMRFVYANNVSQVLEDPAFVKMLDEMKIESKDTRKSKRQRSSADDHRTSAKVSGVLAMTVMIAVASFFILGDLAKLGQFLLRKFCHNNNCKCQA